VVGLSSSCLALARWRWCWSGPALCLVGDQALWDLGGIGAFGASAGVSLDQPPEVTLLLPSDGTSGGDPSSVLFQRVRHSGSNDGNFPRVVLHDYFVLLEADVRVVIAVCRAKTCKRVIICLAHARSIQGYVKEEGFGLGE